MKAFAYLENKHFSSKHRNSVKVPFTDVGAIVIWSFCSPGAVRLPRRGLRWLWFRPTSCDCGQGLCGATVWLTLERSDRMD